MSLYIPHRNRVDHLLTAALGVSLGALPQPQPPLDTKFAPLTDRILSPKITLEVESTGMTTSDFTSSP